MDIQWDVFEQQQAKIVAETRYKNAQRYAETCDPAEFWSAMAAAEEARKRLWIVNQQERERVFREMQNDAQRAEDDRR